MGRPLGHLLIILGISLLHSGGIHLADCALWTKQSSQIGGVEGTFPDTLTYHITLRVWMLAFRINFIPLSLSTSPLLSY